MQKLHWNRAYHVHQIKSSDKKIVLLSEFDMIVLRGEVYFLLAPLLTAGNHSEEELVEALEGKVSAELAYYALIKLQQRNLISSKCMHFSEELGAICGLLSVPESTAAERLSSTTLSLTCLTGPVDADFIALLKSYHIQVVDAPDEADIAVLIVHDYLQPEIASFDKSRQGKPWMLLRPSGAQSWIGPFFEPGKTACYSCLAQRIKHNRVEASYSLAQEASTLPFHAMLGSTRQVAWNLAATELLKRIVLGESRALEGKLLTFDQIQTSMQSHCVHKLSACLLCGEKKSPASPLLTLTDKNQGEYSTQGFRVTSPEETLQKFSPLVSPITGVVKYLEKVEQPGQPSLHVYTSGTNWAVSDPASNPSLSTLRALSGGKGTSEMAAKAGSLCESLERASGVYCEGDIQLCATYREIEQDAIDPRTVLLFSEQQYQNRGVLNPQAHHFSKISEPFPEDRTINWSALYSLTEKRIKYYPTACCYFKGNDPNWRPRADSNGCAAGNCIEEAILQGFFELVERDSVALWWYNRLKRPFVDLESFANPYIATLIRDYKNMGREMWVLDITSDLGIPSFVALSRLTQGSEERIFLGFGTHLDAEIGILRALTEMNQFLASSKYLEEARESHTEQEKIDHQVIDTWMKTATIQNQPYVAKHHLSKRSSDYAKWESCNLLDAILHCQSIVERLGMELLVLNQTRPDIALPVVRVIVPGLRHFWPRFAPGRLYDVPVKMGWISTPTLEHELNPIPMFL